MAYKAFKGKWQAFGDKPIISMPPGALQPPAGCSRPVLNLRSAMLGFTLRLVRTGLTTGLICFNRVCYDTFIKPSGRKYVKLYYDPETKKSAFEPVNREVGAAVFSVKLVKPGLFGVVSGKTFLNACGIKYQEQVRSFPVHESIIREAPQGYKRTWSGVKGIEIKLTEYFPSGT